jgi:hypothetical protein
MSGPNGVSESKPREWQCEGGYEEADGTVRCNAPEEKYGPRAEFVEGGASSPSPAVESLTRRYAPKPPVVRSGPNTQDNEARTQSRPASSYAKAGVTSTGDGVHVGAAALKGTKPNGDGIELFTASGQVGAQTEVQAGVLRGSTSRGAVEFLTARAAAGIHNPDGSTGVNLSVGAKVLGGKIKLGSGSVATGAASLGIGVKGSVGIREQNGKKEVCFSAQVGPFEIADCGPVVTFDQTEGPGEGTQGNSGKESSGGSSGR